MRYFCQSVTYTLPVTLCYLFGCHIGCYNSKQSVIIAVKQHVTHWEKRRAEIHFAGVLLPHIVYRCPLTTLEIIVAFGSIFRPVVYVIGVIPLKPPAVCICASAARVGVVNVIHHSANGYHHSSFAAASVTREHKQALIPVHHPVNYLAGVSRNLVVVADFVTYLAHVKVHKQHSRVLCVLKVKIAYRLP